MIRAFITECGDNLIRGRFEPRFMPDTSDVDTSRAAAKTYVPAYQKEIWATQAERLGMSQSEFIRTMVQAGRRGFDVDPQHSDPEEPGSPGSDPGGDGLEDRVLAALHEEEVLDWDELVSKLTDDVEKRLESALDELQSDDLVRYAGREGGYTLTAE